MASLVVVDDSGIVIGGGDSATVGTIPVTMIFAVYVHVHLVE